MGLVDWIILALLLISAVQGFRKGLAAAIISICGVLVSFFLIGQFYPALRNWLTMHYHIGATVATTIAVIVLIILMAVVIGLLIWILNKALKALRLSTINKLLGAVLGVVNGLLIVMVIMLILDYIPSLSRPIKNPEKHKVYTTINDAKEEVFAKLDLKQRAKYLDKLHKDRQEQTKK